jgi:hypothetical protein
MSDLQTHQQPGKRTKPNPKEQTFDSNMYEYTSYIPTDFISSWQQEGSMSYHNQPTEFLPRLVAIGKLRHEAGLHSRNQMRMRTKETRKKEETQKERKKNKTQKLNKRFKELDMKKKLVLNSFPLRIEKPLK